VPCRLGGVLIDGPIGTLRRGKRTDVRDVGIRPKNRVRAWWLVCLSVCVAATTVVAVPAGAYVKSVTCSNYFSAQQCYVGDGYHSLTEVDTQLEFSSSFSVCAKAATMAGNIRTGSGCANRQCGTCAQPDHRYSCLAGSTPLSQGYGYWADGSGGSKNVEVAQWGGTEHGFC
jgi:hypothetical protein